MKTAKDRMDEIFKNGTEIDKAMKCAVREALILHKKLGFPACEWRDGKVVWVPPEEIDIAELDKEN